MPITSPSAERLLSDPLLSQQHGTQTLLSLVQALHGLSEGDSTRGRIPRDLRESLLNTTPRVAQDTLARVDLDTLEGVRTAVRVLGEADARSLGLPGAGSDEMEKRARRLLEHEFFASRRSIPGAVGAPLAPGEDPIEADLLANYRGALLRTWAGGALIMLDEEEGPIGKHKEEFRRSLIKYGYPEGTSFTPPLGETSGPVLIATARIEAEPILPFNAFDPHGSSEAVGDTLLALARLHTVEETLNRRIRYDNALALEKATNDIMDSTRGIGLAHLMEIHNAHGAEFIERNAATQAAKTRKSLLQLDATDVSPTPEDVESYSGLRQQHYRAEKHGYLRAHTPFVNLLLDRNRQADPAYAPAAVSRPLPSAPPRKRKPKARSR